MGYLMSKVLDRFGVPLPTVGRRMMGQPKPKNRFRVIFFGFGGPEIWNSDGGALTYETSSVTRPSLQFDTHEVHMFDGVSNMSGKRRWSDVTLTVKDTVANDPLKAIARQAQKHSDYYRRVSPLTTNGGYKFEMWIQTLNGNELAAEQISELAGQADRYTKPGSTDINLSEMFKGTIDTFACVGCMVSEYAFGDLDYSDSNYSNLTLTIKVDNCAILNEHGFMFGAGSEFSAGSQVDFSDQMLSGSIASSIQNALKQQFEGFKSELFSDVTDIGIGIANGVAGKAVGAVNNAIGGLFNG